jgi:serine/threonine protein kinase
LEKLVEDPSRLISIHQNILVFDKSEKIYDIASHPLHNLSVAESLKKFYIWGTIIHKGRRKYIRNPQKVELKSIDDIYQKNLKITYKPISGNFRSYDDFINYEKYIAEFEELKNLGEGSFGKVFEAKCLKSGLNFAIKKMEFKEESNQNLLREIENFVIAKDLDETYIVKHFSFWFQNKHTDVNGKSERFLLLYIQMELCQITLTNIIDEISTDVDKIFIKPLNTEEVSDFLSRIAFYIASHLIIEILEGVNYLHKQQPPLIHRDLKPDNILLKIENNINNRFVKIADFGLLAIHKYAEQSHTQDRGTPKYMAPEVIKGKKYDIKADIYSVGKIIEELFRIDFNE